MNEDALIALAYEFHIQGDLQSAKKYYEEFLKLSKQNPQAMNNLATIYQSLGDTKQARKLYEEALTCKPDYKDALQNLAVLCKKQNDLIGAKHYFEQLLQLDSPNLLALNNLTLFYKLGNEYKRAKECALSALEIDPNNVDALNNIGVLYKEEHDLKRAKECYEKARSLDPNSVETLLNLSLLHLLQKDYLKGFDLYRNRYKKFDLYVDEKLLKDKKLITSLDELDGKRVLVCFEQGFGDAIQFIRFLPLLARLNAEFSFFVPAELLKLFQYNFPEISFVQEDALDEFEYFFPILDASYFLGIEYEQIPFGLGYLRVNAEEVEEFKREHLLKSEKTKIGFAFQGSLLHHNDANRSIRLRDFLEGFSNLREFAELYSLQYGITQEEQKILEAYGIVDLGDKIKDFYDTALMVESMDAVISIDSSLLHVSGALGKKAYLMLPYAPDWRWGVEGMTTKWYDSVKIYRQNQTGEWREPFAQITKDITDGF